MIERVAHRRFDHADGLAGRQLLLGLALEFGLADEDGEQADAAGHHVVRGHVLELLVADEIGIGPQSAQQSRAEALFVRAALGRRDGVAVGAGDSCRRPRSRPIAHSTAPGPSSISTRPEKMSDVRSGLTLDRGAEIVLETAGKAEGLLLRHVVDADQKVRRAGPADLDAGEEIGLGPCHREEAGGLQMGARRRRSARSGLKRTRVPRRLWTGPTSSSSDRRSTARIKSGDRASEPRATSTSRCSDSALTTETPTPCRPPEVEYAFEPNLPPECSVVRMTSSADLSGNFGCGSIGMPRPLSETATITVRLPFRPR